MPFTRKAHIEVMNGNFKPISMEWKISHAPLPEPAAELAQFHAKWHRDAFLIQRPDRAPDWPLLFSQGRGRYVGTHLDVWFPTDDWWGEGDEKFFVDGEKFPSTFGTGSEDYFDFSWGLPSFASKPYHEVCLNDGSYFDAGRWHIPDSIPFQKSFEGCIEKYYPNDHPNLYAAGAYWYLAAGGTDPYGPAPAASRVGYWQEPPLPNAAQSGTSGK